MRRQEYNRASTAAAKMLTEIGLVKGAAWDRGDDRLRALVSDYSSVSIYSDDVWFIDKKEMEMNFPPTIRKLHFEKIDIAVKETVKDWALDQLLFGRKLKGIQSSLADINSCLSMVSGKDADRLDARDIMSIYDSLFDGKKSVATSVAKWKNLKFFFTTMGCDDQAGKMAGYVIPDVPRVMSADRYIPEAVATQMDIIFMGEEIPLTYRCIYWMIRLIPNRIEEICSMKKYAVKQLTEDRFLITIPVSKTGGNFDKPEDKHIQVIYEGIGKYLIDLLKAQQSFTEDNMPESQFLFCSRKVCYMKDRETGEYGYKETGKKIYAVHEHMCQNFFGKLGRRLNLLDDDGAPVNITTHKFRHNAVTDRINSRIFRDIDVMYQTGHKNTAMINENYAHPKEPERPSGFRGTIADERRMAMILKRPYAKEIRHLGVCSDVRNCGNNRLACLTCENLEIDEDAVPFMIREYRDWKQKLMRSENIGNDSFSDYCRNWIDAYHILFSKIGITEEDYDGG